MSGEEIPPIPSKLRGALINKSEAPKPAPKLKGTLARKPGDKDTDSLPNATKLKGALIEGAKTEKALASVRNRLKELSHTDIEHAPTWELDFGGGEVVRYGNLETDGFEATLNNYPSPVGQDSFAVSADKRRYAVADGLGGATDKEGTAFLAKFVADQVAVRGADLLFDRDLLTETYRRAEVLFEERFGREYKIPSFKMKGAGIVASTVSCVELMEQRSDGSTDVRVTVVGDSPIFLLDNEGVIMRAFGEDAQRGSTDSPLEFKVGTRVDGSPIIPERGVARRGIQIIDEAVTIPPSYRIVIGSDYFSETAHHEMRGNSIYGRVKDFVGLTPESYGVKTKGLGKSDDATLIAIDPTKVLS